MSWLGFIVLIMLIIGTGVILYLVRRETEKYEDARAGASKKVDMKANKAAEVAAQVSAQPKKDKYGYLRKEKSLLSGSPLGAPFDKPMNVTPSKAKMSPENCKTLCNQQSCDFYKYKSKGNFCSLFNFGTKVDEGQSKRFVMLKVGEKGDKVANYQGKVVSGAPVSSSQKADKDQCGKQLLNDNSADYAAFDGTKKENNCSLFKLGKDDNYDTVFRYQT